jgi:hypothetical protein
MEMDDVEVVRLTNHGFQRQNLVGHGVLAVGIEAQRLPADRDQTGARLRVAAREQRHIVSEPDKILGQVRNHTFRTAIEPRRYCFLQRSNLCYSHQTNPSSPVRQAETAACWSEFLSLICPADWNRVAPESEKHRWSSPAGRHVDGARQVPDRGQVTAVIARARSSRARFATPARVELHAGWIRGAPIGGSVRKNLPLEGKLAPATCLRLPEAALRRKLWSLGRATPSPR